MASRALALETENRGLGQALAISAATVATQAPIVEAYDQIVNAEGSSCITDAAKSLGVRPCDLRAHMRERETKAGWIYGRGRGEEVAYGPRLARHELVHKLIPIPRSDGTIDTRIQVRVTPRGLFLLRDELARKERARRKANGEFDL